MRKIAFGAGVIATTAAFLFGIATPAQATVTKARIPVANVVVVNSCNNENVRLSGEIRAVIVMHKNGSREVHVSVHLTGVGLGTGDTYSLHRNAHRHETKPTPTVTRRDVLVSHGRSPNQHVVVNVITGAIRTTCTGK
jgi:hypothetical protein